MTVWSWHVGRQRQKHCMFDVEPKLSHNEFVVCPPTIYIITWNAHFKVQRPRCLLLARPYGLHFSRALPSADWRIMNFKVGTPCHPAVHPDWMPGTPIDFSTVCHAKAGRLGRPMQELHKHFLINILVQWFPGSHLACGFLDASWSLWVHVKLDPVLWAWKLCIQRWVLTAKRDAVPCFVQHLQDTKNRKKGSNLHVICLEPSPNHFRVLQGVLVYMLYH